MHYVLWVRICLNRRQGFVPNGQIDTPPLPHGSAVDFKFKSPYAQPSGTAVPLGWAYGLLNLESTAEPCGNGGVSI
jgi:hypothetical protein